MAKNLRIVVILLAVLLVVFFINRFMQGRYITPTKDIFTGDREQIQRIVIAQLGKQISLERSNPYWKIAGNDTLVVRQNRLDDFFDKVLTLQHETLVSRNPEKWPLYAVDDSVGTRLTLYGREDKLLGDYIFGRSKSDWARNYIRFAGQDEVYQTNASVIFRLNTAETYWGEAPPSPEPDSSLALPDTIPAS